MVENENGFCRPAIKTTNRMRKIRSRDTGLERAMKHLLSEVGLRYQYQPRMPGRPDFRIKISKILIFCDSTFWHGRRLEDRSGKVFKRNNAFWSLKLSENRRRDGRNNRILRRMGWSVQRFWDTDILRNPEKVKNRLKRLLNGKKR